MLVVGCSSCPWLVSKKDEAAFMGFWSKMLHLPLPDYAARRVSTPCAQAVLWQSLSLPHCTTCCTKPDGDDQSSNLDAAGGLSCGATAARSWEREEGCSQCIFLCMHCGRYLVSHSSAVAAAAAVVLCSSSGQACLHGMVAACSTTLTCPLLHT